MMVNRRKFWIITALVPVIVALFVSLAVFYQRHQLHQARRDWKEDAISLIASLSNDEQWILKEKALLLGAPAVDGQKLLSDDWLSNRMILMSNGEWLVYKNHCPKDLQNPNGKPRRYVSDIFIAKGSNGKWYYSTCHFCVGMIVIVGDDPPPSIENFARRYNLREFDGQSDECLKQTEFMPVRSWD